VGSSGDQRIQGLRAGMVIFEPNQRSSRRPRWAEKNSVNAMGQGSGYDTMRRGSQEEGERVTNSEDRSRRKVKIGE